MAEERMLVAVLLLLTLSPFGSSAFSQGKFSPKVGARPASETTRDTLKGSSGAPAVPGDRGASLNSGIEAPATRTLSRLRRRDVSDADESGSSAKADVLPATGASPPVERVTATQPSGSRKSAPFFRWKQPGVLERMARNFSGGGLASAETKAHQIKSDSAGASAGEPSQPTPDPELVPLPETEPEPNWEEAYKSWGIAWPLHVYGFAVAYSLIVLRTSITLFGVIGKGPEIRKKAMTVSLNTMLWAFGCLRAASLFADPYGARQKIPREATRFLWSASLPCLTAAVSVMLLALLDTTKMTVAPPKFQKLSTICLVSGFHFLLVISTDFVITFTHKAGFLLVVCQVFFVVWGVALSVGYTVVGFKIHGNFSASRRGDATQDDQGRKINRLNRVIWIFALTGLAVCATHVYSILGMYSGARLAEAWPWWILQTFMRTEEVLMCGMIFTIASKSSASTPVAKATGCVRCRRLRHNPPNKELKVLSHKNKVSVILAPSATTQISTYSSPNYKWQNNH